MMDPQDLDAELQAMQWDTVSLEPDPAEVQQLDQELPAEWTQTLEPEEEYTPDELADLLHADLDIPEGDIDQNAQQALNELELDRDALAQERDLDLDLDVQQEQDFDFGR